MQEQILIKKKKIIDYLIRQKVLVTDELMQMLEDTQKVEKLSDILAKKLDVKNQVIDELRSNDGLKEKDEICSENQVNIMCEYSDVVKKREIQDFVKYYNKRYSFFEKLLRNRMELKNTMSISRLYDKKDKETISVIGFVTEKSFTKNGNIILTLEDNTGIIKAIVSKNKEDTMNIASDLVLDEVVGVTGVSGDKVVFVNNIIHPDIPLTKELKKSPKQGYAVFISDVHVGSTNFLKFEFEKFIKWLRGETGSEAHKSIAKDVKYLFIAGDLVDGIGIYPGQEEELTIRDIYEQYKEFSEYLKKVPNSIQIIICAGNHDATRIAEPQLKLDNEFCEALKLPNVILVSNPAMINIDRDDTFPGIDVLMYHGYSFDYYAANVSSIRLNGGYDRSDLIMKFLLQRRHLAPTHTSTLYIPDIEKDPLVIDQIPDIFITGHIHKTNVANYRNITMLSGSCWQSKTSFQEKVGHHPEPCKVPIINLHTRAVKILNFS